MKLKILSAALIALSLVGCGEKTVELKTVQYYLDNPEERGEKLKQCYGHLSELGETQNCNNAETANNKAQSGSLKNDYSNSFGTSSNFK